MEQIVYISTARVMPSETMLDSILGSSRRNNARDGLTGLLVVGGRRFLQVLEGPAAECEAAYARIRADDRHFALVQLGRRTIVERSFAGWDMGF
ncbi:BLUF domain-containing protein [Sphingomonas glaciei]|uniref:BLUF domain-containing protein n=1 Tax=Sphingomonas glaciei TaxID=2938948 RepID=A0ABY5MW59_9SPHN|nr:BLUF domain-containing protein [Sphingomonas glaciei]UUR08697.1 BLUF domain-containing protein [Sphingomonas glaciei]